MCEDSLFSTSSPTLVTCCLFDNSRSDRCAVIILLWFWFAFPWWPVTLSIFSCVHWPSVCLLWKNVYSGPLPAPPLFWGHGHVKFVLWCWIFYLFFHYPFFFSFIGGGRFILFFLIPHPRQYPKIGFLGVSLSRSSFCLWVFLTRSQGVWRSWPPGSLPLTLPVRRPGGLPRLCSLP